ncbi:MAG TPA: TasA family protein [Actinomycetota bacterium]|nr:TasA family protein [Actinomycetota bacterium]
MSSRKVLGIAILLFALTLVGMGIYAAFTDTETAGVVAEAGALDITGANDITISNMAPGDLAFRGLTVQIPDSDNEGDLIRAIRVSVPQPAVGDDVVGTPTDVGEGSVPVGASLLTGAQGLRVTLASCSGAWTLPAAGAALGSDVNADGLDDSASCAGTISINQAEIALNDLVGTGDFEYGPPDYGITPTGTGTFPDGTTLNMIAQFRLPAAADNAYENASLTFDLVFEAIQRAGVNR